MPRSRSPPRTSHSRYRDDYSSDRYYRDRERDYADSRDSRDLRYRDRERYDRDRDSKSNRDRDKYREKEFDRNLNHRNRTRDPKSSFDRHSRGNRDGYNMSPPPMSPKHSTDDSSDPQSLVDSSVSIASSSSPQISKDSSLGLLQPHTSTSNGSSGEATSDSMSLTVSINETHETASDNNISKIQTSVTSLPSSSSTDSQPLSAEEKRRQRMERLAKWKAQKAQEQKLKGSNNSSESVSMQSSPVPASDVVNSESVSNANVSSTTSLSQRQYPVTAQLKKESISESPLSRQATPTATSSISKMFNISDINKPSKSSGMNALSCK